MARFSGGLLEPSRLPAAAPLRGLRAARRRREVTDFASIRTLPMPAPISDPRAVREVSRLRYGRPVDEVEAEIRKLIEGEPEDESPVGRRRREQP